MILAGASLCLGTCVAVAQSAPQAGTLEDGGIKLRWTYSQPAGSEPAGLGTLQIDIEDAATGTPLRYGAGRLAAWLQRQRGALSDAEVACADKVKALTSQGIGRRADIDLNTHRLVTLNTDGSVLFINPFVGLNNAKLESIIELPGEPSNWVHVPDRLEAWILVGPDKLVSVDLEQRQISRIIKLPEGAGPRDLAFDTAHALLWIGLPGRNALARLDVSDAQASFSLLPAPGLLGVFPADIESQALSDGSAAPSGPPLGGLVTFQEPDEVTWRDGSAPSRTWRLGERPIAFAYSKLARRIIAATEQGTLVWIDPQQADQAGIERRLRLEHRVRAVALFEGDRRLLVLGQGRASVVDLASAQRMLTLAVPAGADSIVLTRAFAYAVDGPGARARLWSLADLTQGREQPVDVLLGRADRSLGRDRPSGLQTAIPLPEGSGLIAASQADGVLYQYAEGMMAPVGSYSNYRRVPLALTLLDLSFREVSPGRYVAPVRHAQGGRYQLLLAGVGPRFVACSTLLLPPVRQAETAPGAPSAVAIAALTPLHLNGSRAEQTIRLRLRSAGGEGAVVAGVPDLMLLVFDPRSGWQSRTPLREGKEGEYEAQIQVPRPGPYRLHVSSASLNLSFLEGRVGELTLGGVP